MSPKEEGGRRSVTVTIAPSRARRKATASPVRARPTTRTRLFRSSIMPCSSSAGGHSYGNTRPEFQRPIPRGSGDFRAPAAGPHHRLTVQRQAHPRRIAKGFRPCHCVSSRAPRAVFRAKALWNGFDHLYAQRALVRILCALISIRQRILHRALTDHLNFSVVRAKRAKTSAAIQKRAIIFDSFHPNSSK